jgi:hypothetical protein
MIIKKGKLINAFYNLYTYTKTRPNQLMLDKMNSTEDLGTIDEVLPKRPLIL